MTNDIRWLPFIRYFQQKGFTLIFDLMEERSAHLLFYRETIPSDNPHAARYVIFAVDDEKCKACLTDKELLENHAHYLDESARYQFNKWCNLKTFYGDEKIIYSGHIWRFDPMVKLGLAFLQFIDDQKREKGDDK